MVYQPIVDLRTHAVVGMEALARSTPCRCGRPNEWFAAAVELELGIQLEMMAVRSAMAGHPSSAGRRLLVRQLLAARRDVAGARRARRRRRVEDGGRDHRARGDRGLRGAGHGARRSWRRRGIRVAIDDAGAGFASLRHTVLLDPDIVKVDTSLTREHRRQPRQARDDVRRRSFGRGDGDRIVARGSRRARELETLCQRWGWPSRPGLLPLPNPLRCNSDHRLVRTVASAHDDPAVVLRVGLHLGPAIATASA